MTDDSIIPPAATAGIVPHDLWTTRLGFSRTLKEDLPERLSAALEEAAAAVLLHNTEATDGDNWEITLTTIGPPDKGEILRRVGEVEAGILAESGIISEKLPEKDWLRHVHDNFPPVRTETFFIYGSHYEGAVPEGLMGLKIDAATAFGSGEHETTRGCLMAFEQLKDQKLEFKNALDMGCGSGILAIGLVKLWPSIKAVAVDIDPESVTVTKRHAEMNGVAALAAEAGDGFNAPLALARAPYDIIAANILANPLIEMAPQLAAALAGGGYAVLSGLLRRQKGDVLAAYERLGLKMAATQEIGEWCALVLQKPAG